MFVLQQTKNVHHRLNGLVYEMSHDYEKCSSQFPRAKSDTLIDSGTLSFGQPTVKNPT